MTLHKTILSLGTTLALVALATPAFAHDFAVPVGDDTYYVYPHPEHLDVTDTQVWKESNGLQGLQTTEVTVNGVQYARDTRVA